MSRVVLILDSDTGKLIDATGREREAGRYAKLVKRMLSADRNPVLDYGGNGGDVLTISRSGTRGSAINLEANVVNIPGTLRVAGKTVQEMAEVGVESVLDRVVGTPGQIQVVSDSESSSGETVARVSLAPDFARDVDGKLSTAVEDVYEFQWGDSDGDGLRLDIDGGEGGPATYIFSPPGAITEYGVARIRDLYYAIGLATPVEEGTQQMFDRAINVVDGADLPSALALPDKDYQEQGARARDLYVRVDMTGKSSTSWSPVVVDTHTGEAAVCETEDGAFPTLVGGKINLYHFMETEDSVFAILHKTLTRMPQAGGE